MANATIDGLLADCKIIGIYATGVTLGLIITIIRWRVGLIRKDRWNSSHEWILITMMWPVALFISIGWLLMKFMLDPVLKFFVRTKPVSKPAVSSTPVPPAPRLDERDLTIAQLNARIRVLEDSCDYRDISVASKKQV